MKKRKVKIRWKNMIIFLLMITFFTMFVISSINITKWLIDNNKVNKELNNINDQTQITDVKDDDNTTIINNDVPKSDPYWDFIKTNLIDVNFTDLLKTNPDVKGWINVKGTNINYPFVQTTNNKYYLTHSFDKSSNGGGWIFLDYRNNINNSDDNTIIYGHGRTNKTMFGSLKNILSNNWYQNTSNYIINISSISNNTMWQVFSIYKIENTSDYLYTNFNNKDEYLTFLNMLLNRSIYDFKTSINNEDKILTLSTCYDDNYKIVMHAKLIKISN